MDRVHSDGLAKTRPERQSVFGKNLSGERRRILATKTRFSVERIARPGGWSGAPAQAAWRRERV